MLPGQKPPSDHAEYLRMLRAMTPEQRLTRAFELSEQTREAIRQELLGKNPDLTREELGRLVRERLDLLSKS